MLVAAVVILAALGAILLLLPRFLRAGKGEEAAEPTPGAGLLAARVLGIALLGLAAGLLIAAMTGLIALPLG